jgi:6-phosphogluconolactonase
MEFPQMKQCRLSRQWFTGILMSLCAACCLDYSVMAQRSEPQRNETNIDVWIGTGRSQLSKGIYHCFLNTESGKLTQPILVAEAAGPGFLAMHPSLPIIYAVCSLDRVPVVAAYAIDRGEPGPSLKLLNAVEVGDGGATHVSVDPTGHTLLTAQYGGGSVAVFALNDDGTLKERTQLINHEGGSGVVPGRQDASHAHWSGVSPDNRFAFVPDLGLDKVVIYELDAADSHIVPHGFAEVPPGGGPRHMKFHTNGKFMFVLNELALSITTFRYDADSGTVEVVETVPTISGKQKDREQAVSASEIRVHPNGRFVYSANRGHDTISVFSFDADTGRLKLIEREQVRGATPRNFNIDPTGNWLLAAGQDSHTLASFAIDQRTGELTYNRSNVVAPSAICVMFGPE